MRGFKLINADRLPAPQHNQPRIYAIKLWQEKLKVPHKYHQKFASLQLNCTLCLPGVGLFGRTARLSKASGGELHYFRVDAEHPDV